MQTCACVYMYIYIYTKKQRERERERDTYHHVSSDTKREQAPNRVQARGQTGSSAQRASETQASQPQAQNAPRKSPLEAYEELGQARVPPSREISKPAVPTKLASAMGKRGRAHGTATQGPKVNATRWVIADVAAARSVAHITFTQKRKAWLANCPYAFGSYLPKDVSSSWCQIRCSD